MSARTSVLTLTDTAAPAARRTSRVVTPQVLAFRQLAQTWGGLSGTEKGTWETLAQQNANAVQNGVPSRSVGYAAFVGHNAPLYTAGIPVLTTAPPQQDAPPLPTITFQASLGTGLTLMLSAPTAYAHRVLVYGAKPMLAPRPLYAHTRFLLLGSLAGLAATPTNIGALYGAKFRVLTPGYKIALHLVGLSETGFRTAPLLVTAVAGAAADGSPALTLG